MRNSHVHVLPILNTTKTHFKINIENFKSVLQQVGSRPVVIYSINGASRTGKSYTLNFFIRYFEGNGRSNGDWHSTNLTEEFIWKSGKDRATVGVNIWSKLYFTEDENGRQVAVLLIDCQGLFDSQTTQRENSVIFAFSTVCSSVTLFNCMENINENLLHHLQFLSNYANMVFPGDTPETSEKGQAQDLVFLIRDFGMPDYDYGYHDQDHPRASRNFLKDTFAPTTVNCSKENILTREIIQNSYRKMGVYLLPHPGKDFVRGKGELNNQFAEPDADFAQHLKAFVQLMTSQSQLLTKKIGGVEVTGFELLKFVESWAEICRASDENFPSVQSMTQVSIDVINGATASEAVHYIEEKLEELTRESREGLETDLFDQLCTMFLNDLDLERKLKEWGGKARQQWIDELQDQVSRIRQDYRSVNQANLEREEARLVEVQSREEADRLSSEYSRELLENEAVKWFWEEELQRAEDRCKNLEAAMNFQSQYRDEEMTAVQLSLVEEGKQICSLRNKIDNLDDY